MQHDAMIALGRHLQSERYQFVTITPASHARVLARVSTQSSLRDIFGWSRPFDLDALPRELAQLMRSAEILETLGRRVRSRVRFSTLGGLLLAHSSYPTLDPDAVFLGPDTYRFAAVVARFAGIPSRIVDLGCGSGAGGLSVVARGGTVVLGDINRRALAFARVNAALAGVEAQVVESDLLAGVRGECDLIIANPPYLVDAAKRAYRDGAGAYGTELSVRIARDAIARLAQSARGGRLILYSGAAVVDGRDQLLARLEPLLSSSRVTRSHYEELDPDVFGEELDEPGYRDVERIAAVALIVDVSP